MRINPISYSNNYNYNYKPVVFKQSKNDDDYFEKLMFDVIRPKATSEEQDASFSCENSETLVRDLLRASIYSKSTLGFNKTPDDYDDIEQWEYQRRSANPAPVKNIGNSSYRGESLVYAPQRVPILKSKGVDKIIDLAHMKGLRELCGKYGVDYIEADFLDDYYDNPAFITKSQYERVQNIRNKYNPNSGMKDYDVEARKFINEFIDFTKIMNDGHFYIACNHGNTRTGFALLLNETFNPKCKLTTNSEISDVEMLRNFYTKLTPFDKGNLGFTPEFENKLREKLGIKEGGD